MTNDKLHCMICGKESESLKIKDVLMRDFNVGNSEDNTFTAELFENGWSRAIGGDICFYCGSSPQRAIVSVYKDYKKEEN